MKIIDRINSTIVNMRSSVKRFPITVIISTILAISLIYLQESKLLGSSRDTLEKVNLVLGLGIPLSLCIKLIIEKFFKENINIALLLHVIGAGLLVLYYFFFIPDYDLVAGSRYFVTMVFLILSFLYIPRIKNDDDYEYYIMDMYYNFAITFIYSLVLYLGIAAIFLTIDGLFDVNIKGQFYYYMFLIVSLIFAISLFTSKIPRIEAQYRDVEYTKSLKILILYIVIPLVSIYTAILYVYFGKIIITMEWPRGLVSHLVLWYSTISVGIIFLITPILEENKLARTFKVWFPKIVLPILLMMFIAIWKRVDQYGITENRYYLIVLGLWVSGIMLYFSLKKPLRNIIIPITLSIVMVNSVFGPLSSFAISKGSQNKRLEKILNANNMIENGKITPNESISSEDKKEINNIISYFNNKHELKAIKSLPNDVTINKIDSLTGFKYEAYNPYMYNDGIYFNYSVNEAETILDVREYDYYVSMNSWDQGEKNVDELKLKYNSNKNILIVSEADKLIKEVNITEIIQGIHDKQIDQGQEKFNMKQEDMTYEVEISRDDLEDIEIKFLFNSVHGKINNDDKLVIDGINFIMLIKK